MASVQLEHVEKTYPNGTPGLVDCSVQVDDGELLVVVGPSGCGKSTLLRLVAGLELVTSGNIRIANEIVNDWPPQARNVAMVFQDYALYPFMSVRGNLEFPLKMRRLAPDEMRRRVQWAAGLLDIVHVLDQLPKQLSGGQRQRVAMGRALVREPTAFLLDEPLSNLDAKLRVQVRAEIGELQRRTRTTMIYVTHDQVEAMTLGDRVAVLNHGRVQQIAPPHQLYDYPANAFVAGFIGTPPMNLFPARLEGEHGGTVLVIGDHRVPIASQPWTQKLGRTDGCFVAGLRPEAFRRVALETGAPCLTAVVEHVEYLGHETLAHVVIADGTPPVDVRLIARLEGMQTLAKGERVGLAVDGSQLHLFREDGDALA